MGMMIIRHKVRDYGQWRPIFDRHAKMQKPAGLSNPRVYHSADSNKSEIVVVFDTKDTEMAKDFAHIKRLSLAFFHRRDRSLKHSFGFRWRAEVSCRN
jgi:hypothetical protein